MSWRPKFEVQLHDHLFADAVNKGIASGKQFQEIFDELSPDQDLAGLREKFQKKAFQKRQEAALLGLRSAGWADEDLLELDCQTLDAANAGPELTIALTRYGDAMRARFPGAGPTSPAFVTWDGDALVAADLPAYLAKLRSTRINMEFNGALCRGLKQARYSEEGAACGPQDRIDFLREHPLRGERASAPTRN